MTARIPNRLLDYLTAANVPFNILHHPVAYTAQELSAIEGVKGREHAKVIIVKGAGQCFMAVLPSDHRVDLTALGELLNTPVEMAAEADFKAVFPDCEVGTMPPFGGLYGVKTLVDASFAQNERIAFEAGTHSDAIKMNYADYERLAQPTIVKFAVKPSPQVVAHES